MLRDSSQCVPASSSSAILFLGASPQLLVSGSTLPCLSVYTKACCNSDRPNKEKWASWESGPLGLVGPAPYEQKSVIYSPPTGLNSSTSHTVPSSVYYIGTG